jgi:hypothetical protein
VLEDLEDVLDELAVRLFAQLDPTRTAVALHLTC